MANKTNKKRPAQRRGDPRTAASTRKRGHPGGNPAVAVRKATAADWIGAARVRTLPVAVAPVALGTAVAYVFSVGHSSLLRALFCLAVAVCLQIGVNYANDYSDGVRGTDRYRVGPSRLTASGAAKPRTVLAVALFFFLIAAIAGTALVIHSGQYWLLAIGATCILAAWYYTGGKHPYGYYGLGEVFVFVFFGIVATAGTTYVLIGTVPGLSWLAGAATGFLACAVLMVNNLRDLEQDAEARKRTLAVLAGSRWARVLFAAFITIPFIIIIPIALIFFPDAFLVYLTLLLAAPAVLIAATGKTPPEFMLALRLTSLTLLFYGLGLAAIIAF